MAREAFVKIIDLSDYTVKSIKKAIKEKDVKFVDLNHMMGRGDTYLSCCLTKHRMDKYAFSLLCRLLEVNEEEMLNEPVSIQTPAEGFDIEEFKKAMRDAVVTAIPADQNDDMKILLKRIDILKDRVESLENRLILQMKSIEKQNGLLEQVLSMKGTSVDRLHHERAVSFLKEKMKNGYANESEVYRDADELGIARMDVADARKELGIITSFKGYGKNAHSILIYEEKEEK